MKKSINSLFALRTIRLTVSSILMALFLSVLPAAIFAQQAENTPVISYQGSVTTNSGSQVTGDHLITATLYSDANGTQPVWSGTYKQKITGGVFTLLLGSGQYPLPVNQDFSKSLWIGIKVDGGQELRPLTQLTGAPYSVSVADKSVTKDKIAVDYVSSIMVNGKQITGKGTTLNLVDGLNTKLLYDESTNSLSLNSIGGIGNPAPQGAPCTYWATCGNIVGPFPPPPLFQLFGTGDAFDVIMQAGGTEQMRMLGRQNNPVSTNTFGLLIPSTDNSHPSSGLGVIYQGSGANPNTYIHSYPNITNFFAGNLAGNLTMCNGTAGCIGTPPPASCPPCTDNTGIGYMALNQNSGGGYDAGDSTQPLGVQNTAIGSGALQYNTTGWMNTASGYWALWKCNSGSKNTGLGACALENDTYGRGNTAVGWGASTNGNGYYSTACGVDALHENNGLLNAAFGTSALYNNNSGSYNTACGTGALESHTSGNNNTAGGFMALHNNTTASNNTAFGDSALYKDTLTGYANTAIGRAALFSNTTGFENTASGEGVMYSNTTGYANTASGDHALYNNINGYANTVCGFQALVLNISGSLNTAIGYQTLYSNTSGWYNSACGNAALYSNTTGSDNTASGTGALQGNTTGQYNTASGFQALFSNNAASDNTADGYYALYSNTASDNTASGFQALYTNSTGYDNTAIGSNALYNNTIGTYNTAGGYKALYSNGNGSNNTAEGYYALYNTTGSNNTAFGQSAGQSITTGSNNTFVGNTADASANNLTDASAIGNGATVCASNTMVFGDANVVGWGFGVCPGGNAILVGTSGSNGNGASLTLGGTWTNGSSRSFKDRFHPLDGAEILSKILNLDVVGWYYKGTNEYHIGPVAEDFYSAFETGNQNDKEYWTKHISSVDPAGVALIGIKELKKENDKLQKENDQMRDDINSLRNEIEEIKASLRK